MPRLILSIALCVLCSTPVQAGPLALFSGAAPFRDRTALVTPARTPDAKAPRRAASLFVGNDAAGLFAPVSRVRLDAPDGSVLTNGGTPVDRLRHIIGQAESRRDGYDAVQHGATRRPAKRPTDMTIGEIDAWIRATPGQPHAIGRYQFIPATLRRLVATLDITHDTRFTPRLQDRLADVLLIEAGYHDARTGKMPRRAFMNNLAKIWAGLPNSSGRSHYHGYAGNRASMTWTRFDAEMARIFPG
ncbi:hypothetical protein DU478_09965 [Thalassococcus profundi]|uniref:Glycoside hydrolase family 104 protein n=1 Tax=Thalassococcus profundi TaxID=2282382 RepID=A0A369TLQ5_9RHOB|nr:hypothetical protein [Thalassococcus profundi]RDD66243.1 hypothetical protein DU478_09965 [Thalassococcus profundi]